MGHRPRYSEDFRERRERAERDEERAREERAQVDADAGKQYRDGLLAQREAAEREREERVEASLAPERERERRRWLAEHPDKGEAEFTRSAWPQLRLNILEDRAVENRKKVKEELRRTGRY